jgi:O-antigen ligase
MMQGRMALRGRFNDGGLVALTGALIIYGLIYSHFMSFLTSKMGIPSTPVYVAVIGLGLVMASGIFLRRSLPRSSYLIAATVAAYVGIMLASLSFVGKSAWQLTYDRTFWAMMVVSAIVLVSNIRSGATFLRIVRAVFIASSAIVIAEFVSGFSLPVEMTTVRGRAAGLFENSNISALFISIMVPVITLGLRLRARIPFYALALLTVALTFSRGGLALCVAAIILVEMLPAEKGGALMFRRLLIGALMFLSLVTSYYLLSYVLLENFGGLLDSNTLARVRLEGDSSSDIRLELLQSAWAEFTASPFWGHGTGAGDRLLGGTSAHNQFALVAVEFGVIGLMWIMVLLIALWSIPHPFGIWAAALFTVASMTSHNLTDGATYALILATYASLPAIFERRASAGPSREPNYRPPPSIDNVRLPLLAGARARNVRASNTYRQ